MGLTDRYADWERSMRDSPWAWYYSRTGNVWHNREILREDLPRLVPGSVVRVTLDARRVTFLLKVDEAWAEQFAFTLPEQCGNISLGVSLWYDGKVTLLP